MKGTMLAVAALALALPTAALAKGASQARITGPGLDQAIVLENTAQTPLDTLATQTGFFAGVFGQSPDPMLAQRPAGKLGPRYRITWTMPGPNNETDLIRQDVYPYAQGGVVTYMRPGQRFFTTKRTRGGWFRGGVDLKNTLANVGLLTKKRPSEPTALAPSAATESASRNWTAAIVLAAAIALLAVLATAIVLRRRAHPSPA